MGKKRKHTETLVSAEEKSKKNDIAPERPERTLFGWKNKPQNEENEREKVGNGDVFRNKEKVLITCSRRINFRWVCFFISFWWFVTFCMIFEGIYW